MGEDAVRATCWETASAWPPKVDRRLIVHRALGLFLVWFCVFGIFLGQRVAKLHALALSLIVAALWGFIHYALTRLPAEPTGSVRGRR